MKKRPSSKPKPSNGPAVRCAYDRMVPTADLKPNAANPKVHPQAQVERYAKIIGHQGWRRPIVVSKLSGLIVAGHGALAAAKLMGWKTCPVNDQEFKNAKDETAHLLADNKLAALAETDEDLLKELLAGMEDFDPELLGYDSGELEALIAGLNGGGGEAPEPRFDQAAELLKKWKVKRGQLWVVGLHKILCGDSTEPKDVAQLMNGETCGLCFTSPPYLQQRDYKQSIGDWDSLMQGVFANVPANDKTQVLVNLGLVHRDGEWISYWDRWIEWMRTQGWLRFGWYVWDQGPGMPGDWDGRLAPSHEFVWHFCKKSLKPIKARECEHAGEKHGGLGQRGSDGKVKLRSAGRARIQSHAIHDSVFRVNRQGASAKAKGHPAPYPVGLPRLALESWPGLVFDPFSGSGTTICACELLKRKARAIEIEPAYVAVTLERLSEMGLKPTLTKA